MALTGGCQCGAVRYAIAADEPLVYACHCRECQKQSASAFGLSLPASWSDLAIEDERATWDRPTDSGSTTICHFCPTCGTRLFHASSGDSGRVTVKAGTLDDTTPLVPLAHIWVERKQPWVVLDPATPTWPRQPDDLTEWRRQMTRERT